MPATTPYRRPSGSRRVKTSKTDRRSAVPAASAACSIVNSYWSVKSAVEGTFTGSPRSAVFMDGIVPPFRHSDDLGPPFRGARLCGPPSLVAAWAM
ncbi:hypothetical protein GCM10023335_06790 [Streptomyces siamensis]|uniref:Uncharacterized protein n=1 Tax=Streptomyces siamensis TaxID=1274986 RepID=A0ABP9IFJ4_9ACTN